MMENLHAKEKQKIEKSFAQSKNQNAIKISIKCQHELISAWFLLHLRCAQVKLLRTFSLHEEIRQRRRLGNKNLIEHMKNVAKYKHFVERIKEPTATATTTTTTSEERTSVYE